MDNRYRSPWEAPPCPKCGNHLWVDSSKSAADDWVCHDCERPFSTTLVEPGDPPDPYPIPHPHARGESQ